MSGDYWSLVTCYSPVLPMPALRSIVGCTSPPVLRVPLDFVLRDRRRPDPSSGSNYVYSAYAPQLATELVISSTQVNLIGLAGNLGMYLAGPL